jgi:homoserine kinase type II
MSFGLTEDDARECLSAAYGLGPSEVASVSLLDGSVMNPNWVVALRDGQRVVARCFLRNQDPARLAFQMRFHAVLAKAGLPVPVVLPDRDGHPLTSHAGRHWAVYAWVDGEDYDYGRADQREAAGRLLADLHLALGGKDLPGYVVPAGYGSYSDWAERGGDLMAEAFSRAWAASLSDDDKAFALDLQRWLVQALPARDWERLPKQFVWSDFHGRNLKFQGARVTGLFDFDVAHWESPMFDLGTGLYMLGREARGAFPIRLEAAADVIRGYTARLPISRAEAGAAVPLLVFRYISEVEQPFPVPPGVEPARHVARAIRVLRVIHEAIPGLTALLAATATR